MTGISQRVLLQLRTPVGPQWWVAIILGLGAVRLFVITVLAPSEAVSPDEQTYVLALEALLGGRDIIAAGNELGYGPTIFTGSWILLRTAQFLTFLGLTDIAATRVASVLFSLLTALLILAIVQRVRAVSVAPINRHIPVVSGAGIALLALVLMPSYQVWSSLGLRDASAVMVCVIAAWGCTWLLTSSGAAGQALGAIAITLGVAGTYLSRSSLALILSAAIAVSILLPPIRRRALPIGLALVALVGANVLGGELRAFTPGPKFDYSIEVPLVSEIPADSETNAEAPSPDTAAVPDLPAPLNPSDASSSFLQVIDARVANLHQTREGMRVNAESAFAFNYCPPPNGALETLICEMAYLPVGVYRFLLTPNVLTVPPEAPSQRSFAALENFVWLGLYLVALMTLAGRYSLSRRMTVFVVLFLAGTTVAYALVSGNEGTAFRHKGQFLWAWCLVIALGYSWRPWVRSLVQRKQAVS